MAAADSTCETAPCRNDLDGALVVGKDQRLAVALVEVEIEQEAAAVVGAEPLQPIGDRLRIAVRRMAIGHVQEVGGKAERMRVTPFLEISLAVLAPRTSKSCRHF